MTIEPAEAIIQSLDWMVTDESVMSIDPLTNTITALADGEADLFAESIDQFSYAVCHVTDSWYNHLYQSVKDCKGEIRNKKEKQR